MNEIRCKDKTIYKKNLPVSVCFYTLAQCQLCNGRGVEGLFLFQGFMLEKIIEEIPKQSFMYKAFEYVKRKSHAPEEIIFCTIFSFMGACLKDRICIDFGGKLVFPNIPIIIIAPSGVGKTSSVNVINKIFWETLPYVIPEDCTSESLFQNFAEKGTYTETSTSALWIVSEMADTFGAKDYQKGIIPRITRLLDNPSNKTVSRKGAIDIVVKNTAILNLVIATTFEWFVQYCDEGIGIGGFLPRMYIINCTKESRFTPMPHSEPDIERALNEELKDLLSKIPKTTEKLTEDLEAIRKDFYEELCKSHEESERVFIARKAETFLRIYLVLKVFNGNFLNTSQVIRMAKNFCNYFINEGLSVNRHIKIRKILNINNKALERLNNYLDRNLSQTLKYTVISKGSHVKTHDLELALKFYRDHEIVAWDCKKGDSLVTVLSKPSVFLDRYLKAEDANVEEA